ncbi:MAG: hypothetical protein JOZ78_11615 [Chroococcidiopsidaceae cyanobacterium CP_BM_ER_R8_30]|nr:hypothetical protein [Chroococcidiopsidaceae cyanobacterium CP_BM_ER_R8_30]
MSSKVTPVQPAVLLTIIAESVLQDRLIHLLKGHNVSGYTIAQVQGEGGHGRRFGDIAGYKTNVEIKTVMSREVSDAVLLELKAHQDQHAMIAFRQNVEALE